MGLIRHVFQAKDLNDELISQQALQDGFEIILRKIDDVRNEGIDGE